MLGPLVCPIDQRQHGLLRRWLVGLGLVPVAVAFFGAAGADVSDESGLVTPLILPEGDYSSPFPLNAGGWSQLAR